MRRKFLKTLMVSPLAASLIGPMMNDAFSQNKVARTGGPKLKSSLNAYSFNEPLTKGTTSLEEMLEFCATLNFDAVDITGYYFTGYPAVPTDEYIYRIKRKSFELGLDISGTGVRNDFTFPEKKKREEEVALVKAWIEVAAKLGAPVIRIFAGKQDVSAYSRQQVLAWMVQDIQECVHYGQAHGVIVAIQNHNDFIKTAEEALEILQLVKSEWFGLILDTGSFRTGDPYEEIAKAAPYAVNWQIKENLFMNGKEVPADIDKIVSIIRKAGYRGYLPIETLGAGDPKLKVPKLLEALQKALNQ